MTLPKVEVPITKPDAGKIRIVVSGSIKVTSNDPKVTIERNE